VLELPSNQVRSWLATFGTAAVAVVSAPSGICVAATQDLARTLRSRRGAEVARVWWVSSLAAALELAKAVGAAPSTVEEAERLIRAAAQERGIALAEHEPTLARAKAALARLDHGLAVAEQRGILAASNSRFKFLRLKDPKLDYGKAHSRLKFEIARRIAETSDGGLPDLRGLVNAILPMPTK